MALPDLISLDENPADDVGLTRAQLRLKARVKPLVEMITENLVKAGEVPLVDPDRRAVRIRLGQMVRRLVRAEVAGNPGIYGGKTSDEISALIHPRLNVVLNQVPFAPNFINGADMTDVLA